MDTLIFPRPISAPPSRCSSSRAGDGMSAEWVVGFARKDGTVAVPVGGKRYPTKALAHAAAYDRQREKPFMSFVAVPAVAAAKGASV